MMVDQLVNRVVFVGFTSNFHWISFIFNFNERVSKQEPDDKRNDKIKVVW